ncbi:hypothetical protein L1887_32483 [Cichorium endivia]|nr:hypothetical protein L1887_32483 [Cichorium endivia]
MVGLPHIKHLQREKLKHYEALVVLKRICKEVGTINIESDICEHYYDAIKFAVINDTPEVIETVIGSFPHAIWTKIDGSSIIQVAIRNRCEKVYNFMLCHLSYDKYAHQQRRDKDDNNLLHLAAQLAPIHKLNLVSGAALQMQRELQWFEEVGNFVKPKYKDEKNKKEQTPIMLFREEHNELRKEGEEWMKKTADAYTIVAALIVTMVFAAAITVPGGNDDTGKAIYEMRPSFIAWIIIPIATLTCLPIASFVTLQLPLLVDVISSTYGHGIFVKQNDRKMKQS